MGLSPALKAKFEAAAALDVCSRVAEVLDCCLTAGHRAPPNSGIVISEGLREEVLVLLERLTFETIGPH